MLCCHDNGQQFSTSYAIIPFSRTKSLAEICNNSLLTILYLGQDRPRSVQAGISIQQKLFAVVRVGQYWRLQYKLPQTLKGVLLFSAPYKVLLTFRRYSVERFCHRRVVRTKLPVIAHKPQKSPHFRLALRSRPLPHCLYFIWVC